MVCSFVDSESCTMSESAVRKSTFCAKSEVEQADVKHITTAKTRIGNALKLRFICKDSAFRLLLTSRWLKYTEIASCKWLNHNAWNFPLHKYELTGLILTFT
jgi:hypothetical protein